MPNNMRVSRGTKSKFVNLYIQCIIYMILRLNKWGNSLGLRIPSQLAARYAFVDGISVSVEETEDGLLIKPVPRQLSLDYLLEGLSEQNQHPDYFEEL